MSTKPEIACAIIEGISSVREDEELQDFVVEVEGKKFKCHRLILSACSGFFRGLLRSGMKESQKKRTKLEGLTKETFAAILETLYTGRENLTRDNMLSVWLAADQLQITFVFNNCVDFILKNIYNDNVISVMKTAYQLMNKNITEKCETFIKNHILLTVENWESFHSIANEVGSVLTLSNVRDFIKRNYEQVIKSKSFLCLPEHDLLDIIKSQDMVVSSEDIVIESILYWVNNEYEIRSDTKSGELYVDTSFSPSEEDDEEEEAGWARYHYSESCNGSNTSEDEEEDEEEEEKEFSMQYRKLSLESLLSETRLFLVNSISLEKLLRNTLIMDNQKTKEMVMDALLYKSIGRQHGVCFKAATHRSCSGLENVGVMGCRGGVFYALSYQPKFQWLELPKCQYMSNSTSVKLIAYMTDFFAVGDLVNNSSLCLFVNNQWREVKKLPGHGWLGVAVEEFIYLINSSNQQINKLNPRFGNCVLEDCINFPTLDTIEHICSFDLSILAFCSEIINGSDKTAVHCFDTRSQKWKRLDSLGGSAKGIVSFRKDKQLFCLQCNGKLWSIKQDEVNGIQLIAIEFLWQGNTHMYGVIYINECLCVTPEYKQNKAVTLTSKIFVNIQNFAGSPGSSWSNLIPAVVKLFKH